MCVYILLVNFLRFMFMYDFNLMASMTFYEAKAFAPLVQFSVLKSISLNLSFVPFMTENMKNRT